VGDAELAEVGADGGRVVECEAGVELQAVGRFREVAQRPSAVNRLPEQAIGYGVGRLTRVFDGLPRRTLDMSLGVVVKAGLGLGFHFPLSVQWAGAGGPRS
jgi:hypothetical protein